MKLIETLNNKVEKLLHDYKKLELENQDLKRVIENLRNDNDELVKNNQDMFLKIDSTLTLLKAQKK